MKQTFLILYCATTFISITGNKIFAQQLLTKQWTVFHNGTLAGYDHSNALVCDTLGNVFVTGQSFQNSATGSLTTVKYNSTGAMMWTDNYKGVIVTAVNEGTDICMDPFGNVLATGTVAWNDGDFAILKFNQNGRIWAKDKEPYWFGSGYDEAREIATDAAGNIYCVASIQSLSGNMQDLYTLKCDSAGNDIWSVDYSSASGDDWAEGLAVTPDGHCFSITSSFNFFGSTTYDMQTLHYDSSGTQQWISSYNYQSTASEDYPLEIKCDAAYNQWICGAADVGTTTDMAAMKQNMYGTRLWTVIYNGTANGNDTAIAISYLPNNLTVVTGRSKELVNGGTRDAITTMLIDSGTVLWTKHYYGDSLNAIPTAMTTDTNGNIYISGYYQTSSQALNGLVLVYDQSGALIYFDKYNGTANLNDRFNDITLDYQNNICVTGQTFTASNNSDYVTIKYALNGTNSIDEISNKSDFLIYPNPATTEINIKGKHLHNGTIRIVDARGYIIFAQNINDEFLNIKLHRDGILNSKFNAGIYFVQLQNDFGSTTKKFIIQ